MGEMKIKLSETRVEASSSDLPVDNNVIISWTTASVLCVWCFNGNINSSQYFRSCTRSPLSSEFQMELPFYSCHTADLWETIVSPSKCTAGIITDKPCNPYKCSLTGFLHYIPKVWYTRNAFRYYSIVFNTSSSADHSNSLLTRISIDRYLASTRIFSLLDISTQPQVGRQTQAGRVFPPMIWCLGRCAHCKGSNAFSKETQVIKLSIDVFTCSPRILCQDQNLPIFPAARSFSN